MKRCPTCNREYGDDGLSFCLDDGAKLLTANEDPQATLMISPENLPTFPQTPRQTDPNRGAQPQAPPSSPRSQPTQQAGSWAPPPPSAPPFVPPSGARPAPKRSALPWVIGGLVVVVVGVIGVILVIFVIAALSNNNNNNNNNRGIVINRGGDDNPATPTPTPSGKTLNGSDSVTQITVPSGWEETTGLNASATIQAKNESDGVYMIVITDSRADLSSSMTLEKYAHLSSRKLTAALTDLTETGPDSITVNGEPALLYELHGEISNIRAAYLYAMVQTSGHYHQIGTWTTESKFADRRAMMMSIIESLREK